MDEDSLAQDAHLCELVLRKLATLLASRGMAKQPDMLLPLMDTLGEAARSSCVTGASSDLLLLTRRLCHADGIFNHAITCPGAGGSVGSKGCHHDLA